MFRNEKAYDHAVKAFLKVADCHRQLDSIYLAAKALETAANILAQNLNQPEKSVDIYKQCSDYYIAHGTGDRAGEILDKCAK
jgi:gamma-soluble NSF attachment protein